LREKVLATYVYVSPVWRDGAINIETMARQETAISAARYAMSGVAVVDPNTIENTNIMRTLMSEAFSLLPLESIKREPSCLQRVLELG